MATLRRTNTSNDRIKEFQARRTARQQDQSSQQGGSTTGISGRGGFGTSLISEAAGTGGAIGGASLGAGIGTGILPGIGTVIGGGIGGLIGGFTGGFGGRAVENKVRDDEFRVGDALKEGALSGAFGAGGAAFTGLRGVKAAGGLANLAGASDDVVKGVVLGGKKAGKQFAQGGIDDILKSSGNATVGTAGRGKVDNFIDKNLAQQYGTLSKPVRKITDPARTVRELADAGVYKPEDAARIASVVTGGDGILNKAVVKASGGARRVDTSTLRGVFDDAVSNVGLVDADKKSITQIFNTKMKALAGGAKGSLDPNADPSDVLDMIKSLEKASINLKGKGANYAMPTPQRLDQAGVLDLVVDELTEKLYKDAGANANLANILTPALRKDLITLNPNNKQWATWVDKNVMGAKNVGQIRSAQRPFVAASQMVEEGAKNEFSMGGQLVRNSRGLREKVADTVLGGASEVAARTGAKATRALPSLPSGVGASLRTGRQLATGTATRGIGNSLLNPTDQGIPQDMQSGILQQDAQSLLGAQQMQEPLGQELLEQPQSNAIDVQGIALQLINKGASMEEVQQAIEELTTINAIQDGSFFQPEEEEQELTAAQATRAASAQNALNDIPIIEQAIADGSLGGRKALPGATSQIGRRLLGTENLDAALFNIADNILRARSGAATPEPEVKRFMEGFLPSPLDSEQAKRQKLQRAVAELQSYTNPQGAATGTLQEALSQGGFQ